MHSWFSNQQCSQGTEGTKPCAITKSACSERTTHQSRESLEGFTSSLSAQHFGMMKMIKESTKPTWASWLYDFQGQKPEGGGVMLQTKPWRSSHDQSTKSLDNKPQWKHKGTYNCTWFGIWTCERNSRSVVYHIPNNYHTSTSRYTKSWEERYIRTLIHVLSLVLHNQSSYLNIGYISSSTHVHLTNNSAYEHSWPCSIFVTLSWLPSPDILDKAG